MWNKRYAVILCTVLFVGCDQKERRPIAPFVDTIDADNSPEIAAQWRAWAEACERVDARNRKRGYK